MLIEETLKVIQEMNALGIVMTFRQIYYRLVAKLIIENTLPQYKYLNKVITDARYEGIIPFDAIVDDKRVPSVSRYYYEEVEGHIDYTFDRIGNAINEFSYYKWLGQDYYVEVWVEKQALFRLFKKVTDKRGVTLVACGGYPSVSLLNTSAQRISNEAYNRGTNNIVILYFGDFDPTGQHIPQNIQEKFIEEFMLEFEWYDVALTKEQIELHELPPMPVKKTDTRHASFVAKHGKKSAVELDALDPVVLQDTVDDAILEFFDNDIYEDNRNKQNKINKKLKETYDEFREEMERTKLLFKEKYFGEEKDDQ